MNDSSNPNPKEWRARAVLLLISLLVSFATAEIALRILGIGATVVREGTGGFTFFTHHPILGWDLVPGATDRLQTDEMDIEIRITEQGLRSHRIFPAKPTPNVRRVVVLGDSFSFGHGVDVEQAWPARLETLLSNDSQSPTEVINLSVTGYGTDQQLLRFEERGLSLQPNTVILGLFVGNIFRNAREVQIGYPKPRFALQNGRLELMNLPVPKRVDPPTGGSRLWNLLYTTSRTAGEHLGYGEAWSVTAAIIDRLRSHCESAGIELFVVVIPKDQVVYGQGWRRRVHARTQEMTSRMLKSQGVDPLDLSKILRQAASESATNPELERLYFPNDGHWTAEGHRLAAEAIAQALSSPSPAN